MFHESERGRVTGGFSHCKELALAEEKGCSSLSAMADEGSGRSRVLSPTYTHFSNFSMDEQLASAFVHFLHRQLDFFVVLCSVWPCRPFMLFSTFCTLLHILGFLRCRRRGDSGVPAFSQSAITLVSGGVAFRGTKGQHTPGGPTRSTARF